MTSYITTSLGMADSLVKQAQALAQQNNLIYLPRNKQSASKILQSHAPLFILTQYGLELHLTDGQVLRFHPDTAMLRAKADHDALRELVGPEPQRVLDTTMGLASDAIVLAQAGHQVTALESQPLLAFLISYGLCHYQSGWAIVDQAMRSIKVQQTDNLAFLTKEKDRSFDIIYCDPMFSENIPESHNLDGISQLANSSPLTAEFLAQAKRVAKKAVIVKAHFRDSIFEDFGIERQERPNQKFHYGILRLT